MRAEVKVGLIVGLVVFCGFGIWWVNRGENKMDAIPFDRADMDKAAGDISLAKDAVPIATNPKREISTPKPAAANRRQTEPPPRRTTTVIRPPGVHTPRTDDAASQSKPLSVTKPEVASGGLTPTSPTAKDAPADDAKGPPPANAGPVSDPATPNAAVVEKDTPAPRIIAPARRETVAKPPADTSASRTRTPPTPPRTKYVIRPGDRLIDIAEYEYDDGDLWKAIKAANPNLDENRLQVGATIELPSREEAEKLIQAKSKATTARPTAAGQPTPRAPATQATYVVGTGDTLIKIARNVLGDKERWREIYELNRDKLETPDVIQLGMELKLPPRTKSATDAQP